jgi:hypothetical protein
MGTGDDSFSGKRQRCDDRRLAAEHGVSSGEEDILVVTVRNLSARLTKVEDEKRELAEKVKRLEQEKAEMARQANFRDHLNHDLAILPAMKSASAEKDSRADPSSSSEYAPLASSSPAAQLRVPIIKPPPNAVTSKPRKPQKPRKQPANAQSQPSGPPQSAASLEAIEKLRSWALAKFRAIKNEEIKYAMFAALSPIHFLFLKNGKGKGKSSLEFFHTRALPADCHHPASEERAAIAKHPTSCDCALTFAYASDVLHHKATHFAYEFITASSKFFFFFNWASSC